MSQCSPCSPRKTALQANCIYRLSWLGDLTRIWATNSYFEPFEPSVWNASLDTVTGPLLQPVGSLVSTLLDYRYTSVQGIAHNRFSINEPSGTTLTWVSRIRVFWQELHVWRVLPEQFVFEVPALTILPPHGLCRRGEAAGQLSPAAPE